MLAQWLCILSLFCLLAFLGTILQRVLPREVFFNMAFSLALFYSETRACTI